MRIIPAAVNYACASRNMYCCDADIVDAASKWLSQCKLRIARSVIKEINVSQT